MGMGIFNNKFRIGRRITPFTFGKTPINPTTLKLNKWGFIDIS
jgi:hypothetical protein